MKEVRTNMELSYHVVLVCDIHNFSGISSELEDRGHGFLGEYYAGIGEVAVLHGGRILKYIGDCILFIFGADKHIVAVQCAIEMRRSFRSMLSRYRIKRVGGYSGFATEPLPREYVP